MESISRIYAAQKYCELFYPLARDVLGYAIRYAPVRDIFLGPTWLTGSSPSAQSYFTQDSFDISYVTTSRIRIILLSEHLFSLSK